MDCIHDYFMIYVNALYYHINTAAILPCVVFGKGSLAKFAYYDLRSTQKNFGAFILSVTIMPKNYIKPPDY